MAQASGPAFVPQRPSVASESSSIVYTSRVPTRTAYGTTEAVYEERIEQLEAACIPTSYAKMPLSATRAEMIAPYVSEFLGTFVLVFTAATCRHVGSKTWYATALGCAVVVITYSVGFVSGGHLNPAISLAAFLARKLSCFRFVCYVLVQLFAGFLGGLFFEVVFLVHASYVRPVAPFHFTPAAIVEFLFTAMLCFVWLNVVGSTRTNPENDKNQFFALAIGFAYVAAGYACCDISGAMINPSLALGLDLAGWWRGDLLWGVFFALVELAGGVLAALLFRVIRQEDYSLEDKALYVPPLSVRLFGEFIGTFFLASCFGLSAITLSPATALCAAAALLCFVCALGNVSGGHFNPAVSAAVALSQRNKCSWGDGLRYALAQLLGGIAAGCLMSYVHAGGPTARDHFGLRLSTGAYPWGAAMTMEIMFTFLLAYAVLAVATTDEYTASNTKSRQNFYFAVAIGFAMCAGTFAAARVSGGYLNPAVALAFAVEDMPTFHTWAKVHHWSWFANGIVKALSLTGKFLEYMSAWVLFALFELLGGVLAAGAFRLTHPAEYKQTAAPLVTHVKLAEQ